MHLAWGLVREGLSSLEWSDVESQVLLLFLARLQGFDAGRGVYFPHYIERMLDLDLRAWLRSQRKSAAVPFSQLGTFGESESDIGEWVSGTGETETPDHSGELDRALSLREALATLPEPQRDVVWRCCVLGRTEAAVAQELGLSRSAVRNRLEVALNAMREFFGEAEVEGRTRTGRQSRKTATGTTQTRGALASSDFVSGAFWKFEFIMAKDEKRPDLVGVGAGRPVLLQGTFDFAATGLKTPQPLSDRLFYTVPPGMVLGVRYLRVGNVSEGLVAVSTVVNGLPHRIVPCAANDAMHVSFAIVDPIPAGSQIELQIAATQPGTVIIDCGCLLMPA